VKDDDEDKTEVIEPPPDDDADHSNIAVRNAADLAVKAAAADAAIKVTADAIGGVARSVEEGLRMVLALPEADRGATLRKCAVELGKLGDLCHEQRRAIIKMTGFYLF